MDNTINLSEDPDSIEKKVMNMFTDPEKIKKNDPGHPDQCPVFIYHDIFEGKDLLEWGEGCRRGKVGCVEHKKLLAKMVIDGLEQFRVRRSETRKVLKGVIEDGIRRANKVANETMSEVRKAMKL